jgi:hypothetical protein
MGVENQPFLGMGFMLTRADMDAKEFDILYEELIEKFYEGELFPQELFYCKNLDACTDSYNGAWIFIGEWQHGDEEEIVKMPQSFGFGNGDDIDLELKRQFGEDHPFLKYAKFGTYFGTNWT